MNPRYLCPSFVWLMAWEMQLRRMKTHPEEKEILCGSAIIAQANYVMSLAWENASVPND